MLTFTVKVTPASGKNQWSLDKNGTLKCHLKSPAEKGKANQELIKTLAKLLDINQQDIAIVAGATDRRKTLRVTVDLTYERLLELLGIEKGEKQGQLFG